MLWLFVILQTMAPFIHAHADAVQLNHGGLLHLHQGGHSDAACHAIAAHEHGAEITVAQGLMQRTGAQRVPSDELYAPSPAFQLVDAHQARTGLPTPPQRDIARPAHTLPHALAPPAA